MLEADTQVSVGLMIETVAGVENAQAIAALPGSTICSSALAICPCRAAPPIPT